MLKARHYCGQATLILEAEGCGTFSILEDWTDRAVPTSAGAARLLCASALLELAQLVRQLQASGGLAPSDQKGVDRCA